MTTNLPANGTTPTPLGYQLDATIAISLVLGLVYTDIASMAHNLKQASAGDIGIGISIVLGTIVVFTAIRHLLITVKAYNRGTGVMAALAASAALLPFSLDFILLMLFAGVIGFYVDMVIESHRRAPRQ